MTGHQDFGHERKVISLSQDSFYRELNTTEGQKAAKGLFNFDHPGIFQLFFKNKQFVLIINFYVVVFKVNGNCVTFYLQMHSTTT